MLIEQLRRYVENYGLAAATIAAMAKTDDAYRAFCSQLLKMGVSQKTIGAMAGHGSSWANKWLTKAKKSSIAADEMDQLDRYFEQLARLLEDRPRARRSLDRDRKAV